MAATFERNYDAMATISRSGANLARLAKPDYEACIICGKAVLLNDKTAWIHEHKGGNVAVTDDEAGAMPTSWDCGWWPIGADCLRKQPQLKPYVQRGI